MRSFEAGRQPACLGRGFVDGHALAGCAQIKSSGQAGDARADDGNVSLFTHFVDARRLASPAAFFSCFLM